MTMTPVPGYLTELTLNLVDIGIRGRVTGLSLGKNVPAKPRFGQAYRNVLAGGQKFASLSANGHVDKEGPVGTLVTAYEAEAPVAFEVQVGEAAAATDVGAFTGNLVIETLELNADAEGEWEWSITAQIDGAPLFTPAV